MRFHKYHGAGNDFVMLLDPDGRLGLPSSLPPALVAALCDRHTGIGADGVIRIMADADALAAGAALRMDYYNADGSTAEMCGNGIRCLAVLARSQGLIGDGEHTILTLAGPTPIRFEGDGRVTVDMGRPRDLQEAVSVDLGDASIEGTTVSMGNPHLVVFDRPLDEVPTLGPRLEVHPDFPSKTNVEFAEVLGLRELRMRVWERGIGETQACGSGACAVAVVAAALGRTEPTVTIHLPGGDLEIARDDDGRVWMTGPAEEAFEGTIDAAWLRARGLSTQRAIA